jgi:hypothetical protein
VKKRLLFYGVNVHGDDFAVNKTVKRAIPVLPHSTNAPLPLLDDTGMPAQSAFYLSGFKAVVHEGFFHSIIISGIAGM